MLKYNHVTVLLQEAIDVLHIKKNGIYLDATFGCGGHSRLILSKLNKQGRLLAVDCDPFAIKIARTINDPRLMVFHGSFSNITNYIKKLGLLGRIDGILLDLGISSYQLENSERGFSFMFDGPLDMRMNPTKGQSAMDWLIKATCKDITWVLKTFGEERFAKSIAQAIVKQNQLYPITSTFELSKLILNINSLKNKHKRKYKHPATRSFQAIRIYINNELEEIKHILSNMLTLLTSGGRLSIISFHSLEDRLIKQFINQHSSVSCSSIPVKFPLTETQILNRFNYYPKLKNKGKIFPTKEEIKNNPRARSSILRFAEKI